MCGDGVREPLGSGVRELSAEVSKRPAGRRQVPAGQLPVCGAVGASGGGVNFLPTPPPGAA